MTSRAVADPRRGVGPGARLPTLDDRWCSWRALDNPVRRWLAPARPDVDRLAPSPGSTVADLGTGVGFHVDELLRRVGEHGRLWLIDPDATNLARAVARAPGDPRVSARVGSAAHLAEIPDGSVDGALLSLVLCCLVEKEAAMDEVWRILRPGGRALVSYPDRRVRLRRSSRSLRVTPERWATIRARHPWEDVWTERGWVVRRRLLERPRATRPAVDRRGTSTSPGPRRRGPPTWVRRGSSGGTAASGRRARR